MKYFDWDDDKNNLLKETRDISFEEIVLSLSNNKLLEIVGHPNKRKYPDQKMFIVEIRDYAYIVPFVEDEEKYFLKTIYPSREATKKYLNKEE
ncbi:MAG: BrnT family toxin [Bacteroidetes bacterium]|nr:BrnT family toxin [Bacteroidota bacterium]MBU2584911.1 BrnT family toxin [Bacteroidota bacterium]